MRIVLVGSRFADRRNMEHLVYRIGEILKERNTISIVGPEKFSKRIENNFEISPWHRIKLRKSIYKLCIDPISYRIIRLVEHAKFWDPDVLVALGSIGVNGLAVAVAGKITGIPSVVRVTSDIFRVYSSKGTLWQKVRMFIRNNVLGYFALKYADRILLLHRSQAPELESMGIQSKKMLVVPQPIVFPPNTLTSNAEMREQLGIQPDATVVLCTMRLDPDKKIGLLTKVVNRVMILNKNKKAPIHFVIIGEGECKEMLQKNTEKYDTELHFLDEQPRDKLSAYYRMADMYLHLSKSEGLSNCIAEAIFFGLPVIASDSGTITKNMVSNISDDFNEIANMITTKCLKKDEMPIELIPENNRYAWLDAIETTINI